MLHLPIKDIPLLNLKIENYYYISTPKSSIAMKDRIKYVVLMGGAQGQAFKYYNAEISCIPPWIDNSLSD